VNDAPDINIEEERAHFWEAVEAAELEQAREEFLSLPCPACGVEALRARGETGWECGNCGANDVNSRRVEPYWIEVTPEPVLAIVRAWHLATNKPASLEVIERALTGDGPLRPLEAQELRLVLDELVAAEEVRQTDEGYAPRQEPRPYRTGP
jgi:ribosomal protein S27AE